MDRYSNIKPWNHNRVRLQVPDNQFDYVNASAIELPSTSDPAQEPLRYIAMQGPTEPSFAYVWRMIAEQLRSPAVIIQLTSMVENGTIKCHQYFPDDEEETEWSLNEDDLWEDGWKARLVSESVEELASGAIEKRKLLLHVQDEEQPRVIWHLLYRKWPDFGLPEYEDLESFFEMMRLSRELSTDLANPRIIHCSAGVGRTGTFISLEHLMRELELGALRGSSDEVTQADLVHDTVDLLRQQRRGMVQGELQYRFIYQVMRRLWQERYGSDEYDSGAEPAAKRLEVGFTGTDPFFEQNKGIDGAKDGEMGNESA
jgi:protein-tyrosine phosphatase